MLPNHFQETAPTCLSEEVGDHVDDERNPVAEGVLLILAARRLKRPVYKHRATDDVGARNKSPIAAVFADVAIVAHAEISISGHNDLAALDVRPHGEHPLLRDI